MRIAPRRSLVAAGATALALALAPLGDVIVLMPPLAMTEDELSRLVRITAEAIAEATAAWAAEQPRAAGSLV